MDRDPQQTSGYWYPDPDAVKLLAALRRCLRADEAMRRRISAGMDMNARDLRALQYVVACERTGPGASPRGVADHLAITTAATTKLIDRLTASGHLERRPHPTDRRSVVLVATEHAHRELRERLGHMHERMRAVAEAVPAECRQAVLDYLDGMTAEFERAEPVAPLRRATGAIE